MTKLLCLTYREECTDEMQEILKKLDKLGAEIHMYTNLSNQNIQPHDVLNMFEKIYNKEEKNRYILITNISNLFSVVYRIYHQIFNEFIYFQETDNNVQLDTIYETILKVKAVTDESLHKPIYVNNVLNLCEFNIVQYLDYPKILDVYQEEFTDKSEEIVNEYFQKYYRIEEQFYLFEPVLGKKKIINLELSKAKQGFNNTIYLYDHDIEKIDKILKLLMTADNITHANNLYKIEKLLLSYEAEFRAYDNLVESLTSIIIYDIALENKDKVIDYILLVSFLAQSSKNASYFVSILYEFTTNSRYLSVEMKYYIWNQLSRTRWVNTEANSVNTKQLVMTLYKNIYGEFKSQFINELEKIYKSERDNNVILVLTRQFLVEENAPTRSALERCYTLGKLMGKRVILINTKVFLTQVGYCMYYKSFLPNEMEGYNNMTHYYYKNHEIPFYQPSVNMPDLYEIKNIINVVKQLKPWLILSIGGGNIVADLCGEIAPVATISIVFSAVSPSMGSFSIIGRKLTEHDKNELIKSGYMKDSIIESKFTFDLKPQLRTHTKEEYGIPKEKFLLAIVGLRLSYEIKKDFIESICKTFVMDTHLAFVGSFDEYEKWCTIYPDLKEHSTYIGLCTDVLGFMELIDLYINPKRVGGGFSIIEAFHHGKPGITLKHGDVAVAGGEDFCVESYEEMNQLIKRYIEDKEFYMTMSYKARDREREMTDPKEAMENIIHKIEMSKLFF